MNSRELSSLVAQGESERLEFKKSTGQRSDAAKTVCAMLNGLGGFVLFGVTDEGDIAGQDVSSRTMEDLANELRKVEPPGFPDLETIALENGRAVIAMSVTGGGGPYTFDGRPYQRFGPTTSRMPAQRYERMLMERIHASHRWENQQALGIGLADLDHDEIARTIREAIRRGRMEDPATTDPEELLLGLGLIHEGQLLNAAAVLFGRADRLMASYPQCIVRLARFRGRNKTEFIDNRQHVGNAFDLFVRAQRFLRDHLPVSGRVEPGLFERIDDPLYPPEALREAIANAICHRDYGAAGGSVSIGIYDDRLEITSTGILPFGLTPEDLSRPHPSRPWNPLIAQVFYRRGLIESWGRGTLRMVELSAQAGLNPPEFEVAGGEVVVRFGSRRYVAPAQVSHDLSALQRELLDVLAQHGSASLREIIGSLSAETPERTVQDNLQLLRSLRLVDLSGRSRAARWMLHEAT